ncbi:hypothetical protein Acsp03_17940 [Actinomadura sp. NBRC 104412]|uniref:hypothetical protein n=1 Tax=Actinomadura sp. NBRC 104412 TaxID=3032203 RepID=UPI0024A58899|nr:hypothetical protein [Actinomadura sp. NBRC 104412]GLZ04328.1 hypothetical protein Acsp03_17940 [Actinomadura sp. NBRC 104412]
MNSGPTLTAKAISCYFPDAIILINARDHVRAFLFHLTGEDASSLGTFAAHER